MMVLQKKCPCHSGKNYRECCQIFHQGRAAAPTALTLMRSRYAAYALNLPDYIISTTHPAFQRKDKSWREEILHFSQNTQFEGLEILGFEEQEATASVTFFAKLTQQGRDASFKEKSRFQKIKDKWYYLDGIIQK